MSKVSRRYAQALFDLAQEAKAIEPILSQMKHVTALMAADQDVGSFFDRSQINFTQAEDIIKGLVRALNLHTLLENFMLLLAANDRLKIFGTIFQDMLTLNDHTHHILRGQVASAHPLPKADLKKLEKTLSEKCQQTVFLEPIQDKSLLGGLVITVNSYCWDTSLKTQLKQLQQRLKG